MSALRLVRPLGRSLRCQPSELLLVRNVKYPRALCAFISSKANMEGYQRPPPFPYKEKNYNHYYQNFDRTSDRFNENTKVLVVDGPIAAGKSTFAKQLAEDLDMMYFPEASFDDIYINSYGFDIREHNKQLPVSAHYTDIKDFTLNPKHPNAGPMQVQMQMIRFEQYIDALAHLYNTGQGVVLDRSIYSDFVFMEAMRQEGYMSKQVKDYYLDQYQSMKIMLKQPHLVIYLDVPVNIVQQRIKERNRDWEVNSPALTEKYLSTIEKIYKTKFLKEMNDKSEVLIYDWSNFGDVEIVVEDVERLHLEVEKHSNKFKDWAIEKDREHNYARWEYTLGKHSMMLRVEPNHIFPEMMLSHEDSEARLKLLQESPGERYEKGYNPDCGDNVLWKLW